MLALVALLGCQPPAPVPAPLEVQHSAVGRLADGLPYQLSWSDGVFVAIAPEQVASDLRITPGLVDAHAHPAGLGAMLTELDLVGASSLAETLERVRAHDPGAGWVLGRGWDQNDWSDRPSGGFPTATQLDAVTRAPAVLRRIDGHAAWLNSAALQQAGIGPQTADPAGGRILRDDAGAPTGILIDNAMDLVQPPEPSDAELDRRLTVALQALADVGLTGIHDAGASDRTLDAYARFDAAGALPIRVAAYAAGDSSAARRLRTSGPWAGERYAVVGVKLVADGALGSRGAWLSAPYADEPGQSGLQMLQDDALEGWASDLIAHDAQLAVHAIGDAAIHQVLDAYEKARAAHPDKREVPLRVEHVQVVRPEDVPRFAALNVVASMQPTHCTSDMPWAPERLGPERTAWAYRWRDLLDAGAVMAFGSDVPVERPDVALGLWSATRRQALDRTPAGGWSPDQALTLEEAIALFSEGPARAAGQSWSGLAVGAPADLVIWRTHDDRPWEPLETWVGGQRVDSRD